jgi:hypothetical protein
VNERLPPVACGIVCALVNVVVISLGLSALDPHQRFEIVLALFGLTFIPCAGVGGLLGWLAGRTATASVGLRRALLIAPAIVVVYALGYAGDLDDYILLACIPTIVAALVLERWTRSPAGPPVPVAVAR